MSHRTFRVVAIVAGLMGCSATTCAAEPPLLIPVSPPRFDGDQDIGNPVAADVNRDGRADLIVPAGRALRVLLAENGDEVRFRGAHGNGGAIDLPFAAGEIVAADFNRDQKLDLALASHDSYDVFVLIGDGTGKFAAAPGSPFAARRGPKPHTHGLAVGNFNEDDRLDVVVANNEDNDLSLLLGDGRGAFAVAPRSPFPCGRDPYPIAVGDIDGDGHDDVVVPNSAPGLRTITLLRGNGRRGELSPAPNSPVTIGGGAFFAATGDLNGDRRDDVVVTHNTDDGATILLAGADAALAAAPASPLRIGHKAWGVAVADMDGDGHADLVFPADEAVRVFLGDGTAARFRPAPGSPFATGKGAWRLSLGDFNGDGRPDVVTRCVEARRLELFITRAAARSPRS